MIDLAEMPFEEAIQTAMKLFGYDRAQAQEMVALCQGKIQGDTHQNGKKQMVWGSKLKGGRGSGNWRHAGRPGQVGGSGAGMSLPSMNAPSSAAPARAPKRPAAAPASPAAPAAPASPAGSVTPVSSHLDVHATDTNLKFDMRKVTEAIDKVHGDGPLEKIPMYEKALHGGTMGDFMSLGITAKHIRIKTNIKDEARLSVTHEIGHFIDHGGGSEYNAVPFALSAAVMIGKGRGRFPKAAGAAMAQLETAIKGSDSYQSLLDIQKSGVIRLKGGASAIATPAYTNYLLDRKEVWARAYSQYIATKSGSYHMTHELHQQQRIQKMTGEYPRYWEDKDFAPIAAGFDALFAGMGWSK